MIYRQIEYLKYYCKVHNKTIYYFKESAYITGLYQCWDCVRDLNNKK